MNRVEEIKEVESNIKFMQAFEHILEIEYQALLEDLVDSRIVNLCNGVKWSDAEDEIIYFLYENNLDYIENCYAIKFEEQYLSDLKLIYLCNTGKSYN